MTAAQMRQMMRQVVLQGPGGRPCSRVTPRQERQVQRRKLIRLRALTPEQNTSARLPDLRPSTILKSQWRLFWIQRSDFIRAVRFLRRFSNA